MTNIYNSYLSDEFSKSRLMEDMKEINAKIDEENAKEPSVRDNKELLKLYNQLLAKGIRMSDGRRFLY